MRIPYAYYMLAGSGRTPPHKSAVKLTAREAAAQGALYPIPGSIEYRDVPDDVSKAAAVIDRSDRRVDCAGKPA